PKRNTQRLQPVRRAAGIVTRATVSSTHPTKIEIDRVRKADPRLIREQCFSSIYLLDSIDFVIPARNVSTIQGSAQCAEVDQKKSARLRIAPNACVLPRYIYG